MREVLFRGKRINGEWVYGYLLKMFGELSIMCFDDENNIYPVDEQSVGQYTGLTDKNGNKIFEGDIVLKEGIKNIICFGEANILCCGCCYDYHSIVGFFRKDPFSGKVFAEEEDYKDFEVVGNIFDSKGVSKNGD